MSTIDRRGSQLTPMTGAERSGPRGHQPRGDLRPYVATHARLCTLPSSSGSPARVVPAQRLHSAAKAPPPRPRQGHVFPTAEGAWAGGPLNLLLARMLPPHQSDAPGPSSLWAAAGSVPQALLPG